MKLFKIKTKLRRFLVNKLKLNRPTSWPFITGDGFRSLAQHFFDEMSDFKPEDVETNDIVFVRSDFLKEFFAVKHPLIKNRYILLSHNEDENIGSDYEKFIDDKIIHWFAQNLLFVNKKATPLPIGITNYCHKNSDRGNIFDICEAIKRADGKDKKDRISFGFAVSSNQERINLKKYLEENNLADKIEGKRQRDYFEKAAEDKFTASPEGRGVDCHRTWESLYLRIIPMVKRNSLMEYFCSISLPLLLVDKWEEVNNFNEEFLKEKYSELSDAFKNPAIFMNYWIELILSKKI